jgi:hypothetical protein
MKAIKSPKSGKTLPIKVSLDLYDSIHVLKANTGNTRMNNSEFYTMILTKGLESLKL